MGKMVISIGIMFWKDGKMLIVIRNMLLFFLFIHVVRHWNNENQWEKWLFL